jgi:tetratricopeptide (TPR) repeat protein
MALALASGVVIQTSPAGEPAPADVPDMPDELGSRDSEIETKPEERPHATKTPPAKPNRPRVPAAASPRPKPGPGDNPEIYRQLLQSTVLIINVCANGDVATGTGWIVDKSKRLIVTNDHVVDGTKALLVLFPAYKDGKLITDQDYYLNLKDVKPIPGKLIDSDSKCDLALIHLETMPAEAVPLKRASQSVVPGEVVHSLGNPLSASGTVWVYTTGNVRQVHRFKDSRPKHGPAFDAKVVSTQSPVNHGDSGGPVVNGRMELVAVVSRGRPNANLMQFFIDVDEVRGYLRTVTPLAEPKTAKEFNRRGIRHFRQDRYDDASQDFAAAVKLDPTMMAAVANRGSAFLEKKDYATALADFNAAIRGGGQEDWIYKGRGRVYLATGKHKEAIADFTEALRRKPDAPALYNYRGMCYANLKQHTEAIADYTRALEHGPLTAALYNRGVALTKLARRQEAIADFTAALQADPGNANYFDWRGFNFWKLKRYEEALKDWTTAIKLDGENALYRNERGDLLYELTQYKLALQDYDAAVSLNPKKALYYFNRGMAFFKLGVAEAAAADFAKAIQLDPQYKERVQRAVAKPARGVKQPGAAPKKG